MIAAHTYPTSPAAAASELQSIFASMAFDEAPYPGDFGLAGSAGGRAHRVSNCDRFPGGSARGDRLERFSTRNVSKLLTV
jgi:hypothetical protein